MGTEATHRYRIRTIAGRYPSAVPFGSPCRVLCSGRGNVLIELEDGTRVVTSRWAVRRLPRDLVGEQ